MAFPWQVVITAIPWKQVIENAPKLAEGAQNLFSRIKKDKTPRDISDDLFNVADESAQIKQMETIVREHRHEIQALHRDLQDTTDLLHDLTKQNNDLVRTVERLRQSNIRQRRVLALFVFALVLVIVYTLLKI
ncbi:MAG: hypothetical protein LBS40_08055 [Burkholderiales bacterium]|jgi:septal ring factor EnvC (AmiA/AmiB activator)|nr:hypothetical protein [Burkholderiales bacterium]